MCADELSIAYSSPRENILILPGTIPGGLVSGPRAYQDQFHGFKSHRVHPRRVFFLHRKTVSGKRESVSELHSMKIDDEWER